MRQSRFSWLGAFVLLVPVAFAAVFGWRTAVGQWTIPLMVLGGLLTVLSGRVAAVELGDHRISWRHLLAGAYGLFAVLIPIQQARWTGSSSTEGYVLLAGAVVTACCLLLFAVEIARDGRHFDVTPNVDRVLAF
jgi:hypothetical protein